MRLAIFLTLPAAVGLYFLAVPIISLIYERGEFKAMDSLQTGMALQCYALGLVAYACVKVLSPAFYAIDRRWTPMFASFAAIGLNLAFNYVFIFRLGLGHRGLALATSLSAAFNFAVLYVLMRRFAGGMDGRLLVGTIGKCVLGSVALGVVCWVGISYGSAWLNDARLLVRATALLGLIAMAAGTYGLVCLTLGVGEMKDAAALVLRKLRRGRVWP
jgi:putative peptidoglycan lipid II flippase